MLHECMKTRMVLTRLLQKPAKNSGNVKNVTRCSQITGRYLIIKSNLIHIRIVGIIFRVWWLLLCYKYIYWMFAFPTRWLKLRFSYCFYNYSIMNEWINFQDFTKKLILTFTFFDCRICWNFIVEIYTTSGAFCQQFRPRKTQYF